MRVLVTGGAGYIGTHTCVALLQAGHQVVVLDNFSNSQPQALARVQQICAQTLPLYRGDVGDAALLQQIFAEQQIDAVMHFAGAKAVGESVAQPLFYYRNNVTASLTLIEAMSAAGVTTLVFSSSATVYGDPHQVPIVEDFPLAPTNPYGRSKLMVEQIIRDHCTATHATHGFNGIILRYFNPVGAHPSGLIGEDPHGIPNNLMPFIAQVAVGRRRELSVFGDDYPTLDGTGVRDYIHVCDLAEGHVRALEQLHGRQGCHVFNLGTGSGISVLQMVQAYAAASGCDIPYRIVARRAGDVAQCFADASLAQEVLGWQASRKLTDMVASSWRWQSTNPHGYSSTTV
ncbi:UDP-glucose 4-epimerase GalE [Shewanella dokdonensis]|uniref:UDP-glucose 4-epimerase n=1 Tax=Shewanella dokdonensis TaxID=712036 RepID=A0ABX8DF78_9GAMM|nr:UDP-glucose 4-epimerase GalE [Shewanella dokdonensis]MCL1074941.1 UDP-glucose 4-epimerase GalE [Shewanella dokdonensis]QVK23384.1 UDP-glucose 4-epimerase GalE [Shewanella dokdonensis]